MPAQAGIQYIAASVQELWRQRLPDRPLSRTMTPLVLSRHQPRQTKTPLPRGRGVTFSESSARRSALLDVDARAGHQVDALRIAKEEGADHQRHQGDDD